MRLAKNAKRVGPTPHPPECLHRLILVLAAMHAYAQRRDCKFGIRHPQDAWQKMMTKNPVIVLLDALQDRKVPDYCLLWGRLALHELFAAAPFSSNCNEALQKEKERERNSKKKKIWSWRRRGRQRKMDKRKNMCDLRSLWGIVRCKSQLQQKVISG